MRYDIHEYVDELIGVGERTLIRFNSWNTPSRKAGQDYLIQVVPIENWSPGISSFDVAFREPDGFIKSIVEVVPHDYSVMRPSFFEIEWTLDLSEALLFDSESIRLINFKGIGVKATPLRLVYTSSEPEGWLESGKEFPAQLALDRMIEKTETPTVFL